MSEQRTAVEAWTGGYYFDYFVGRWQQRPSDATQRLPRRTLPRHVLLSALVEEIERADSETKLYASLLARCLIGNNMKLMDTFGECIVKLGQVQLVEQDRKQR